MTNDQWDEVAEHMNEHITWPATKQQIIEACNGDDTPQEVQADIKANLADRTYNTADEVKMALVK